MFRPFRRVDGRTNWEAPACECPCVKPNYSLDVLDIFPRELQWHHRVRGVTHLPETKGEPEAWKTVLHSGKGKEPLPGSLTHQLQPSLTGNARRPLREAALGSPRCFISSDTQSLRGAGKWVCMGLWLVIFLSLWGWSSSFHFYFSFSIICWAPMVCRVLR